MTDIIHINREQYKKEELLSAAEVIRRGGLVAFPTETVYGLGANALDGCAAEKIYAAKGRPSDNPLIVHIYDKNNLEDLAENIPEKAWKLAERFWPGPLTMVVSKKRQIPYQTTGGLDTVAIRCPQDVIARDLIELSGTYIAAPSANLSGKPSPTSAKHVIHDMMGRIDTIIDGGEATLGLESTIVDLTSEPPILLRPGFITVRMLQEVIGEVLIDPVVIAKKPDKDLKPKAPGMKYKHYAPEGNLCIVEGEPEKVVDLINQLALEATKQGKHVGIITTSRGRKLYKTGKIFVIGEKDKEETIAAGLYRVLRELDEEHIDTIYTESFMDDDLGQAIMNRLLKAAGYHVLMAE